MSDSDSRLRWRCRRGMRELDQLLTWFLERRYPQCDEVEKAAFSTLLDEQDPELWNWMTGREVPANGAWKRIVDEIRTGHRV